MGEDLLSRIVAPMARAEVQLESLEKLNEILQHSKQPSGFAFSAAEVASVADFLENLASEGFDLSVEPVSYLGGQAGE